MAYNGYDDMKKFLNIGRELNKKKKVNEAINTNLSQREIEDEMQKFREAVTTTVEFGIFKPYSDNVEFNGELLSERIKWVFSLDSTVGCYITCEQTQLNDETVKDS